MCFGSLETDFQFSGNLCSRVCSILWKFCRHEKIGDKSVIISIENDDITKLEYDSMSQY